MTIDNFKEKYIKNLMAEKGIAKINENHFKKDTKIIRNLSQISYRLLNFILYSHLFFARLYTNNIQFDRFLPKNITWMEIIHECWELLKIELSKQEISEIEIFMNYIFFDLFSVLNEHNYINNYESLITLEKKLDEIILTKIKYFKSDIEFFDYIHKPNENDKLSPINLLEEKYHDYKDTEIPFYKYFYYSDYINEEYLLEKLNHIDRNKYPVLLAYLENEIKNSPKNDKNYYSLDILNNFNNVLNLFNEKYSHSITRDKANLFILEEDDFYKDKETQKLIDKFILFYNSLNLKNEKMDLLILSTKSKLSDFFVDDNTDIGKSYIDIYSNFIKEQINKISKLIEQKIQEGIFDNNSNKKINIQNAKEDDIFTFKLPKKYSFIDLIFDNSYRKVIINNNFKFYNQYEINYEAIEEKITGMLLKNKKLFNDNIINFVYINEDLFFDNTNIITKFNNEYIIKEIDIDDKYNLFKFYNDNKENMYLNTSIINDFIKVINYLNNNKDLIKHGKPLAKLISENTIIYDIFDYFEDTISNGFKELFNENNTLFTVNKITNIFEYYLILVFGIIKKEFKKYQIEIDDNKIKEINKYFEDAHIITKEVFKSAIRKFISLFLFQVEDKENRIKKNINNIVNYLNIQDIWDFKIYNRKEFIQELNQIKNLKIYINQILPLYELLGGEKDEIYFEDKRKEEKRKEKEKLIEEELKWMEENNEVQSSEDSEDDYSDRNDDDVNDDFTGKD